MVSRILFIDIYYMISLRLLLVNCFHSVAKKKVRPTPWKHHFFQSKHLIIFSSVDCIFSSLLAVD